MATFQKFNSFVEAALEGKHDFQNDTFKVMLTNSAPVAANSVKADLTEIAAGNGYVAGGPAVTISGSAQTGGTYKATADDEVITAAGGTIGPFRYAVVYNDTATNDELVCFFDYGSAITLNDGETLTIDFDGTNGLFQVS